MVSKNDNILLLGDTHLNRKEHRIKAFHKYIDYLIERYSDYTLIQMGDLFDTANTPYNIVRDAAAKLNKFKSVIILTGNHDYNHSMRNSLLQVDAYENIRIIDKVTVIDDMIFMPYPNLKEERNELENLTGKYEYGFGHVTTATNRFYEGEEINFNANLVIDTFFTGHIHDAMEIYEKHDNGWQTNLVVVGVPYPTRNGEQDFKKRVIEIKSAKYQSINLPELHTIEDVTYGNEPDNKDNVLNIKDAPSIPAAKDFYQNYYVRLIELKKDDSKKENEKLNEATSLAESIVEKYKVYADEKELEEKVVNKALQALTEVN